MLPAFQAGDRGSIPLRGTNMLLDPGLALSCVLARRKVGNSTQVDLTEQAKLR